MRLLRSMRWHWHEELVKPQDRWAEDKEIWAGGSHLYFILIEKQKQGEGYKFLSGFLVCFQMFSDYNVCSLGWNILCCRGLG